MIQSPITTETDALTPLHTRGVPYRLTWHGPGLGYTLMLLPGGQQVIQVQAINIAACVHAALMRYIHGENPAPAGLDP